ncbi:hypothetical protein J1614_004404 [Plenodomus biglobosus]|nr:hypothetical protein J1614_004404 [Plenodomus biglobosus]
MASTDRAPSESSDDDDRSVHVITKEDIDRMLARPPPTGPNVVISPLGDESVQGYPGDVQPRLYGIREIRVVVEILEGAGIPCCMVSEPALIYYGTKRLMMDWLICVPTEQLDAAAQLFRDKPEQFEPFQPSAMKRAMGIEDYFPRFKFVGLRLFFILMSSQAHDIPCKPENIEYSQMGLPYPKLPIYAQSLLDTRNFIDLVDLIDGMNLTRKWGEENLNLEGTINADWGR